MTVPDIVRRKGGRSRAARRAARGGSLCNSRQCKGLPATSGPLLPQQVSAATPTETSPPRPGCHKESALQLQGVAAAGPTLEAPSGEQLRKPRSRNVSFDLEAASEHEVTPYSEIYGLHPSEFMFERNGFIMLLTDGDFSDEDEDSSDDDEQDDGEYMEEAEVCEDSWVMVHGT